MHPKKFRHKLNRLENTSKKLFSPGELSIDDKYNKWMKKMSMSIGKSTIRQSKNESFSNGVKEMRKEKRQIKKRLKNCEGD